MAVSPLLNSDGVVSVVILSAGTDLTTKIELISIDIQTSINRINTAILCINDGDMPDAEMPLSDSDLF